jgi:hypothetical protein
MRGSRKQREEIREQTAVKSREERTEGKNKER